MLIVVVFIIAAVFVGTYNRLKKQQIKVQEADSGIDVALTKRFDMLTKLFDVAKSYLAHEQRIIMEAVRLRSHMPIGEKLEAERKMNDAFKEINLVGEAYPALSSQTAFKELQRGVMDAEEHLQAARRLYNANASTLNQSVASIPTNIVAGMAGIKAAPMFVADQAKRSDVQMHF